MNGSMAVKSSSQNLDSRNKGGAEPKKKLKKLTSIKLSKVPSLKPPRRRGKSRFDSLPIMMSGEDQSLQEPSVIDYSDAKKKNSRGRSESDENSVSSSSYGSTESTPSSNGRNYLKATSCSGGRKYFQASPHNSESNFDSCDQSKTSSVQTLKKTSGLRSGKTLKKKTSFKSKRLSINKFSQVSQDPNVDRATCSSTLKVLKIPEPVDLFPGESDSERISVMKICSYHHCSLHGHCHSFEPLPKACVSERRSSLKTPKIMNSKNQWVVATKHSGDKKKEIQTSQRVFSIEPAVGEGSSPRTAFSPAEINKCRDFCAEKVGEVAESDVGNEDNNDRLIGETAAFPHFCTPALSLKPDDPLHPSDEEIPNVNSGLCKDEPSNIEKRSIPDVFGQATEDNEGLSAVREKTNGNSNQKEGSIELFTPVRSSEANATVREASKKQFRKEKNFSMWHLIHQHMVSDLSVEAGAQSPQGADKKEQVDDANSSPAQTPCLSPGFSHSDMGMEKTDRANQEIEIRKMFAIKLVREAIEKILLPEVQDQSSDDQSTTSDAVSEHDSLENNQGEGSTKESFRENEIDNNEVEGDISADPKEESLTADNIRSQDEQKQATKVGNKSDKQTPKSWSNLKKWILLKRFVKELEKVKKFNPRKPRHLPLDPDAEAEEIRLSHQTTEDKKNAEQWMLDYALRQAINQLAPTQKRKVALLVRAFETVVPPQEEQHIQITIPKLKSNSQDSCCTQRGMDEPVSEATGADQKAEEMVASNPGDKLCLKPNELVNYFSKEVPADENARQEVREDKSSSLLSELLNKDSESSGKNEKLDGLRGENPKPSETNEKLIAAASIVSSASNCDTLDQPTAAREEKNREAEPEHVFLQEFSEKTISSPESELLNGCSEPSEKYVALDGLGAVTSKPSYITKISTPDAVGDSTINESTVSSYLERDTKEQQSTAREENRESEQKHFVQKSRPLIGSQADSATQSDKQNHIRMWHMIYQHVVSGIAEKVGTQLLLDGSDEEVEDSNTSPVIQNSGSSHDFSTIDHDTGKENLDANHQRIEFSRSDAVKLVQEAVDEILLPDTEDDSSDAQSTASDIIPEQELLENNRGDGGVQNFTTSTCCPNCGYRKNDMVAVQGGVLIDQEEKRPPPNEELKAVPMVKNKPHQQKSKNWSKLKKLILLKRSIKALETVRKSNSKPPQLLPLTSASEEEEKVDLRHQMVDERKKAEQWMLDYAVQHIVTKLTPARKRRVAMLVEAFEAVVPLPEV
ncbi:unnamed protein product [Ilex paraguariensis]|uniref:Calmodulin-binding domain-containing protein n=1 Tax=Ilex paraguariensis TaxID=185542 RepID=A0ABC8RZD0_9AQUA